MKEFQSEDSLQRHVEYLPIVEVGLRWNMPIVTALAVYSRLLVDFFTTPASYTGKVNIVRTSFSGLVMKKKQGDLPKLRRKDQVRTE